MQAPRSTLARGVIAGFVGATVIALWFLLADLRAGQPFRTPAFLAGMLRLGDVAPGVLSIAIYTVLHYLVFAMVGFVTVRVVERLGSVHALPLGLLLGATLFVLVLYGSIAIGGYGVMDALGWAPVLIGNLLGGLAIAATLGVLGVVRYDARGLRGHTVVREGIMTGLIGAGAVAIWFFIADTLAGRVLFTPAALGSAIFLGARSTAEVVVSASIVLGYTVLHVAAFLALGLLAARVVAAMRNSNVVLLGAALLFVTLQALAIGLLAIAAVWLVETLAWWNIAVANLAAVLAMGGYLYITHRDLVREFRERNLEAELAGDYGAQSVPPRAP